MSSKEKKSKKQYNPALKYAGMAMQMAIMIGIGIFAGKWLDNYFQTDKPYFTIFLAIFFLSAVLYSIIRDVSKS